MKEKRASLSEEEKARLRTYNREKAREYRTRKHQDTGFPGGQFEVSQSLLDVTYVQQNNAS